MTNEQILFPIFKQLYNKLQNNEIVIDANNSKTLEILSAKIEKLNPSQPYIDFKVKKSNKEYIEKELKWYSSQNRNINGYVDDITIWKKIADNNGITNSNYGWCIFSEENFNQYDNCKNSLLKDKQTRQAVMIYNRPSMHIDYNENGRYDFICTYTHQFFIRNNRLHSIYSMRSNDLIYGFFNDFAWASYVHIKMYNELKSIYTNLENGELTWIANSLHIYERHWGLLEKIYKENKDEYDVLA